VLLARLLGYSRAATKKRAGDLLEAFDLVEAGGRLAKTYSGGMRRRLDIAASIIGAPKLIFLDEPTTGLDPRSRNQVWDTVRAVVSRGATVLLTTQYLEEADQLADRIAVIDHGKVIAEGTVGELKASVGTGAVHVRLLEPGQRAGRAGAVSGARRTGTPGFRPHAAVRECLRPEPCRRGAQRAVGFRYWGRRFRPRPAEFERGVSYLDGSSRRGHHHGHRGGCRVSTAPTTTTRPAAVDTSLDAVLLAPDRPQRPSAGSASLTLAWRAALKMKHAAVEQLFDVLMMPLIFLLIFTYLFGGAFAGSVDNYLQFFLPGVLVMAAVMQTLATRHTVSVDIAKGIFDRFRTMPFWQPASLVGTMLADLGRYLITLILTAALGLLLGFRPEAGVTGMVSAILVILVFSFAFAWIFTTLGLIIKNPDAIQTQSMLLMAVVFCSNIFVASSTMPSWIRAIVDVNPISHLSTAVRGLLHGTVTAGQLGLVGLSTGLLLAIFAPLTMFLYNKQRKG
jgi:ABC-2 type transport system permease protein